MEKIVVKFKHGKIRAFGNPAEFDHIALAAAKLRLQEVEPNAGVKAKNTLKRICKKTRKFFRCVKYALSKDDTQDVVINRNAHIVSIKPVGCKEL